MTASNFGSVPPAADLVLEVQILDQAAQPVPAAQVELKSAAVTFPSQQSNVEGRVKFLNLAPGSYTVSASKEGFETVSKTSIELAAGTPTTAELVLVPSMARKESIEVKGEAPSVEQGATTSNEISGKTAKELPGRPATGEKLVIRGCTKKLLDVV